LSEGTADGGEELRERGQSVGLESPSSRRILYEQARRQLTRNGRLTQKTALMKIQPRRPR
jgi:hypothetical protein